ncbi:Crp/Fnr family transcriptional regulator [Larkinella soli]|uniref:Crp/Fnr family transcriptional regulator n=1 Tax=Larkinella soli TaxID=1770527 RepID=UPI000FFC133F|nr:Crp/Fnr family transcriptional regulator [Larkinella soli]
MIALLEKHLRSVLGGNTDRLEDVLIHFREGRAERNELLLQQGQVCRHVYFIGKGCLQVFGTDEAGSETTREFYFENHWVTDIFGFQHQLPSAESIRALEPSDLALISFSDFQKLVGAVPQFAAVYRQILEISYNRTVYRVNTLISLDALGRLRWLLENQPKILTRLSSKQVASYLGISPETLTRLKARL